jgi:hypothetical protein
MLTKKFQEIQKLPSVPKRIEHKKCTHLNFFVRTKILFCFMSLLVCNNISQF